MTSTCQRQCSEHAHRNARTERSEAERIGTGGTGRENLSVVARAQMKRKNRAPISTAKWAAVAARDGWNCVYCGCSVTHWRPDDSHLSTDDDGNYQLPAGYRWANLDHVTPWSAGGSDDVANLAMSCAQCNQRKRDKVNDWSAAQ